MENSNYERLYKEFRLIVCGKGDRKSKMKAFKKFYLSLGKASLGFENYVYETMGMSAEEVLYQSCRRLRPLGL